MPDASDYPMGNPPEAAPPAEAAPASADQAAPSDPIPVAEQKAAGVPPEETVTIADQKAGVPPPELPDPTPGSSTDQSGSTTPGEESGSESPEPVPADEPVLITPVDPTTAEPPATQDGPTSDGQSTDTPSGYEPPADAQPLDGGNAEQVTDQTLPKTMADATATDPSDPVSEENPLSSVTVHEGVLVRLKDVFAHVENWAARHPEISRLVGYDLKSALGTVERVGPNAEAAPVGDTQVQEQDNAQDAESGQ